MLVEYPATRLFCNYHTSKWFYPRSYLMHNLKFSIKNYSLISDTVQHNRVVRLILNPALHNFTSAIELA